MAISPPSEGKSSPLPHLGGGAGGGGIFLLTLLLAACTNALPSTPPTAPLPAPTRAAPTTPLAGSISPTPASTAVAFTTPSPQPFPRTHYTLTVVLNYASHLLVVDERIDYYNHAPESLDELILVVEPLHYPGTFNLKGLA